MGKSEEPETEHDACRSCAVLDRRNFLRDASLAVVSVLAALGAMPSIAAAAPLEFVTPLGGGREDKSYPLPAKDGTQIDKDNQTIITRWQNKVYVFSLACPHQNTALRWYEKDQKFECPKHHSRFQPDGKYIEGSGRATRNMDRFAIARDGGGVSVDVDKLYEETEDGPQWAAAVVKLK